MTQVALVFEVNQTWQLTDFRATDIGYQRPYFDRQRTSRVVSDWYQACLDPLNSCLYDIAQRLEEDFSVSFHVSGLSLDLLHEFSPKGLTSFYDLAKSVDCEFVGGPYYHSLTFLYDRDELGRQLKLQQDILMRLFGASPQVFALPGLMYNDYVGFAAHHQGYRRVLAPGNPSLLKGNLPHRVFRVKGQTDVDLVVTHVPLSEDFSLRFGDREWAEYPIDGHQYADWLAATGAESLVLYIPYNDLQGHLRNGEPILHFLDELADAIAGRDQLEFVTLSALESKASELPELEVSNLISRFGDCSRWNGNALQQEFLEKLFRMQQIMHQSNRPDWLERWSLLQSSDYLVRMSEKARRDWNTDPPPDVYICLLNILADFALEQRNLS